MATPQYALAPDLQLVLLSLREPGGTAAERAELRGRRAAAALTGALGVLAGTIALFDATMLLWL